MTDAETFKQKRRRQKTGTDKIIVIICQSCRCSFLLIDCLNMLITPLAIQLRLQRRTNYLIGKFS